MQWKTSGAASASAISRQHLAETAARDVAHLVVALHDERCPLRASGEGLRRPLGVHDARSVAEPVEGGNPPILLDLVRAAQVDDGTDAEGGKRLAVLLGQPGEVIRTEQTAPADAAAVGGEVSAEIPKLKTFENITPRSPTWTSVSQARQDGVDGGRQRLSN